METEIWSVEEWLEKIGMSEYAEGFVDNGYETIELVSNMKADDMDAVGVTNKQHRGILFTQARLLLEETTGIRPAPLPPSPVITLTMSGSASPTTPNDTTNTSGYTEPWDNKAAPQVPLHSPLGPTTEYSEPWNATAPASNGISSSSTETTDSGSGEGKPPPLPPPNKPKGKAKKPPPSPGVKLPEYKREDGEKGLTKLQLKLKIRDELLKDAIVLSEYPYCHEDRSQNEEVLIDLASQYAERFGVESLGVYDALRDVWRHTNNKSDFATPSTKLSAEPTDNYDEPFDTQAMPNNAIKKVSSGSTPKEKNPKSQTLPSAPQSNYDEPFDTVIVPPSGSPQKIRPKIELSKTLPSPKVQKKGVEEKTKDSPPSPPTSKGLGRLFGRNKKVRSQSTKEDTGNLAEEAGKKGKSKTRITFPDKKSSRKKRLSADNVVDEEGPVTPRGGRSVPRSVRASVAGYPVHNGVTKPSRRGSSLDSGSSGPSESEESPGQKKKHGGKMFQRFITPPTLKRNQSPVYPASSGSDDDKTPPALRRLKQLSDKKMTGSDLDISVHVEDADSKGWMHVSRSYDNLAEAVNEEKKSDKKKGGFFKRLRMFRKSVNPSDRKKSKDLKSPDSVGSAVLTIPEDSRESLTGSTSMPNMNALSVLDRSRSPSPSPDIGTRTPPKPALSLIHSPLSHDSNPSTSSQLHIPMQICSAPTNTSYLSNGSVSKSNSSNSIGKTDSAVLMVRTRSSGSTKSLDLTKPPPPPKPSTLTRKASRKESADAQSPIPASSKPVAEAASTPPPKPARTADGQSTPSVPPKPARKSIKRGGVTEEKKKELKNAVTRDVVPDNESSQGSMKQEIASPTQYKSSSPPTPAKQDNVTTPPPKPSRNYKSVKILTKPPDKPAPPAIASKTLGQGVTSDGGIKPSELLRRSHSPVTEQGSEVNTNERPVPKPRDSGVKKPSLPNKPPRKSIKLNGSND